MKRKKILSVSLSIVIIIGLIFAGLYSIGFFSPSPPVKAEPLAVDTNATEESVSALVESMNTFAYSLYQNMDIDNNQNVFFSPYSIFVALSMTYEGARNQTAEEMQTVLGFQQNDDTSLCSFGRLYNLYNQHKTYTLKTANSLWTQHDFYFLPSYLRFINNYYMGKATELDFSQAQQAADQINAWIEEQTNGKIEDMLQASDIHPLTKMILCNAIYFKGDWKYQFNPDNTEMQDFYITQNNTVSVPMMHLANNSLSFNYMEDDEVQILELPYKGDNLSMILMLPKEHDISLLESNLSWNKTIEKLSSMTEQSVRITIPKFTFETEYSLKEALQSMGMQQPFSTDADFSGMDGNKDLCIDKVLHNAFIQVDEVGTEAAAATTVHMTLTALPPSEIEFTADHPFMFFIQHNQTGNILFMGKIINPQ